MSQTPNQNYLQCPRCTVPLSKAGSHLVCALCRILVKITEIKDVEVVHFTAKELEEKEKARKAKAKEAHIAEEKLKKKVAESLDKK